MGVPGEDNEEAGDKPSTVRTMHLARLIKLPEEASPWQWELSAVGEGAGGALIALDLVANAFLPQMVRTIVGTLLEVGQGKRTVEDIERTLMSRDRRTAGPTAKPHGLCLVWVEY
jgi:tRNA pseudouridine38-40 synthase